MRVECERTIDVVHGLIKFTELIVSPRPSVIGQRIVAAPRERLREILDGAGEIVLLEQSATTIVVGPGIARAEPNGLCVVGDGACQLTALHVGDPAMIVDRRRVWENAKQLGTSLDCALGVIVSLAILQEIELRYRCGRADRQNSAREEREQIAPNAGACSTWPQPRYIERSGHRGLRLGEGLQEGDEICAILCVGNAGERHLAARRNGLGVFKIAAELVLAPDKAALAEFAHVVGVGVTIGSAGFAPDDVVEGGTDRVFRGVADEVAGTALLEHVGAVLRAGTLR